MTGRTCLQIHHRARHGNTVAGPWFSYEQAAGAALDKKKTCESSQVFKIVVEMDRIELTTS